MAKSRSSSSERRKTIDMMFVMLGGVATVVLLVIGVLSWWGYSFATNSVHDELAAQKIYFPEKGAANFSDEEFPDLQQYAGQQVDNGPKAKAYANGYIGRHLEKVADGKTYSEVSAMAMKDPTNTTLQQQKQTLFQGETLRGLLLGDGYAYWTFGTLAWVAAVVSFAGASVMAILVFMGWMHMSRL